MTLKILEWLRDLGPFVVSLVVLVVTRWFSGWQVRLAKQKLRHDLYDRRSAVRAAFMDLLIGLVDKSDTETRVDFQRAGRSLYDVPSLFGDPEFQAYLEKLLHQVRDRVITNIMFLQSSQHAGTNDPQMNREIATKFSELASSKAELADDHRLKYVSGQFDRFLRLTDFLG